MLFIITMATINCLFLSSLPMLTNCYFFLNNNQCQPVLYFNPFCHFYLLTELHLRREIKGRMFCEKRIPWNRLWRHKENMTSETVDQRESKLCRQLNSIVTLGYQNLAKLFLWHLNRWSNNMMLNAFNIPYAADVKYLLLNKQYKQWIENNGIELIGIACKLWCNMIWFQSKVYDNNISSN